MVSGTTAVNAGLPIVMVSPIPKDTVTQDSLSLLITGLSIILLGVTTVALDTGLFTMKGDYWVRFRFIALRYGLGAYILWVFFVLLPAL